MGSGGPLLIEHFHDDPVELFCDLVQLGPVACAGGSGGFVCPVLQCLCHCPWPAEVGTLRPGCERLRDGRHHLDLSVCAKSSAELVCGDLLQRRRERLHEVRGERTVDHCPKGRVFRGVHAVRHRHVHGDAAAEGGVVGNGFHYVIVARQRPAERLTAGDRTAFAEVVVRRALVVLNLLVARVPVPAQIMARPLELLLIAPSTPLNDSALRLLAIYNSVLRSFLRSRRPRRCRMTTSPSRRPLNPAAPITPPSPGTPASACAAAPSGLCAGHRLRRPRRCP